MEKIVIKIKLDSNNAAAWSNGTYLGAHVIGIMEPDGAVLIDFKENEMTSLTSKGWVSGIVKKGAYIKIKSWNE